MTNGHDEIATALRRVIDTLQQRLAEAKRRITIATEKDDWRAVKQLTDQASAIGEFIKKVEQLSSDWSQIKLPEPVTPKPPPPKPPTPELIPLKRTPQDAFRLPILEALVDMGGRGTVDAVLRRVEQKIGFKFTPWDKQMLPSGVMLRWRNTAQWCRLVLVHEGLLSSTSPRGVWEITPAGRGYLERANRGLPRSK